MRMMAPGRRGERRGTKQWMTLVYPPEFGESCVRPIFERGEGCRPCRLISETLRVCVGNGHYYFPRKIPSVVIDGCFALFWCAGAAMPFTGTFHERITAWSIAVHGIHDTRSRKRCVHAFPPSTAAIHVHKK